MCVGYNLPVSDVLRFTFKGTFMLGTTPKRALVVMAHPDEVEHFVAGTVAAWRAAGAEIAYVILTAGEKGSQDPSLTLERLTAIRQDEQRAAASLLGVDQIHLRRRA